MGKRKRDDTAKVAVVVTQRKKRVVEVIEFDDPTSRMDRQTLFQKKEKRLFMSESISKIRSGNAPPVPEAGGLPGAADAEARQERLDNAAMKKMADEILKLGTSTMEAKARRRFQVSQLIRAGAIAPKSAFVPKDILKGMRAKSKERAVKQRELEQQMGTYRKKKEARMAPRSGIRRTTNGGHWVDNSSIEDSRFKDGALLANHKRK